MNLSALADWWHSASAIDPWIKPEPLYNSIESASPATMAPESSSLKRRRSDESQDMGEKRQRVEPVPTASRPAGNQISEEFQAALAKAAGATMEQHAPSSSALQLYEYGGAGNAAVEHTEHEDQGSGFTSDPHLYMRILSLPILESLVGATPLHSWKDSNSCTVYPDPLNS
jgi:hypothetical protein